MDDSELRFTVARGPVDAEELAALTVVLLAACRPAVPGRETPAGGRTVRPRVQSGQTFRVPRSWRSGGLW